MKPGTELPWEYEHITTVHVKTQQHRIVGGGVLGPMDTLIVAKTTEGDSPGTVADLSYAVRAANLYPRLVDGLKGLCDTASDEWTDSWPWFDRARALLAECGEE